MSFFMAWSAFQDTPAGSVMREILSYFDGYGIEVDQVAPDPYKASWEEDALVYDRKPWVIVKWPERFLNRDVPLCMAITRTLENLASTNTIAEDDVWRHALVENGTLLDVFANRPDYYCDTEEEARILKKRYIGNAENVARALGVTTELVSPYFVHLGMDGSPKAFPDDENHLGEPWSFRDFWRRVGIIISKDGQGCVAGFRPLGDWSEKLPGHGDFAV